MLGVPISIGALYETKTGGGTNRDIRITDIHIDEDGDTQVEITHGTKWGKSVLLDAGTVIDRVENQWERVNTDSEAYTWQQHNP
jgi:hypothetical protein